MSTQFSSLIGYARVSTADQNPSLQIDALTAAGCNRNFIEAASGAQTDRPELKAALDYIRPGETLVVWKLDRLARSLPQLISTIESLQSRGCDFKSLTEAIDTTTASGKLVFHVFAALTEFERNIIRERTIAGLQAARARGPSRRSTQSHGRPEADHSARIDTGSNPYTGADRAAGRCLEATLYKYMPHPRSADEHRGAG